MNRQFQTLCLLIAVLFAYSCKKEEDHHADDTSTPLANIHKPIDNAVYTNGDTIWIKASTTDNDLHGVFIQLTDDTSQVALFYYKPHSHGLTSLTIDTFWKSNVTKNTKATMHFHSGDHAGHVIDKHAHITINK